MALSGNFTSMTPSDLLQMLAWGSQTGLLTCTRDDERRHVFLHEGDVVGVSSSRYKDRLGAMLLRLEYITNEQFNKIFDRQITNGRPLGEIFKSENLLSEKNLQSVLNYQAEEIIYDLLAWSDGAFSFEERELTGNERRLQPVVIANLLLEGARRMDEINRFRSIYDEPDTVYRVKSDVEFTSLELDRPQQTMVNMLMSSMSLAEIFRMVNESEYDIYKSLDALIRQDVIEVDKTATERRREEHEKRSKLLDMSLIMEEKGWFHEALSNIEDILKKEPENADALAMKERLIKAIIKEAKLVFPSTDEVPEIRHAVAAVSVDKLHFNPREGFVFSRIDGNTSIRNLRYLTGMPRDDLFVILHKFIRMGLIFLDDKHSRISSSGH